MQNKIITVSGSPHPESSNSRLLRGLSFLTEAEVVPCSDITALPVFQPALDRSPWPQSVLDWRASWAGARGAVFSTPSYLHNLPGVLKNALDWLASSGEPDGLPVLVFSFTPGPPRGERARQSLLWSLDALNSRVVAESALYQPEIKFLENGDIAPGEQRDLLLEAMMLLSN